MRRIAREITDVPAGSHDLYLDVHKKIRKDIERLDASATEGGLMVALRNPDDKTVAIDVRGSLDALGAGVLTKTVWEGIHQYERVILNFSDCTHLDPDGASALVIQAALAARRKASLVAWGLGEALRDAFRLTRLDEAIRLFDHEGDASDAPLPAGKSMAPPPSPHRTGAVLKGWAPAVDRVSIRDIPAEAMNLNVDGRQTTGPVRGFGRLWDKTYRLRIADSTLDPSVIVSLWRSEFSRFWPTGNRVYPSRGAAIEAGTAALLNLTLPGGLVLATGVLVFYADERSFSFMTVQGHILSGWITFSAYRQDNATILQVNPLFRATDPLMELSMRLGAARQEDRFWHATLANLAGRLGVRGALSQEDVLIDGRLRWPEYKNLWYSAAIRSSMYMPVYGIKRLLGP